MKRRTLLQAGTAAALGISGSLVRAEFQVGDNEIVLGNTGILGGPLGVPVTMMLKGGNLLFDDLNAKGGIHGRKLRVVSLDDELKPPKAVANCKTLLEEHKAFAFFGCVGSGTTAATGPVLKASGAAAVGGFAVADSARDKVAASAYFVRAATAREGQALVQHLTTIGITRIAVAHLSNAGGLEVLKLLTDDLAKHKLAPVASSGMKGDGSDAPQVAKLFGAQQPQAVLMYLGGSLAGKLINATAELGNSPSFYGMSIVPGEVTAKVAGERARGLAIAQIIPYPWGEVEPLVREYQRLCEAAKLPVGYYTFEGYLNAVVMSEALKRTGRELTRPRLHAVLRGMKMRMAGMNIDFTHGGHTGSRFIELVQVTRDGRFLR